MMQSKAIEVLNFQQLVSLSTHNEWENKVFAEAILKNLYQLVREWSAVYKAMSFLVDEWMNELQILICCYWVYNTTIQFNQKFACKALCELGVNQYQNYTIMSPMACKKTVLSTGNCCTVMSRMIERSIKREPSRAWVESCVEYCAKSRLMSI